MVLSFLFLMQFKHTVASYMLQLTSYFIATVPELSADQHLVRLHVLPEAQLAQGRNRLVSHVRVPYAILAGRQHQSDGEEDGPHTDRRSDVLEVVGQVVATEGQRKFLDVALAGVVGSGVELQTDAATKGGEGQQEDDDGELHGALTGYLLLGFLEVDLYTDVGGFMVERVTLKRG